MKRLHSFTVTKEVDVLKKEEFPTVKLKDGDVLEIVRPVGGG